MLVLFRLIALLEGISFLILILIGVPFKYFQNNDAIVKAIGMPHGYIIYIVCICIICNKTKVKLVY